jgi:outer membrane protein TolC
MVKVSMPLFEGGDTAGAIKEANSVKHQQEDNLKDLELQVEEDVRLALWGLRTSVAQVRAAAKVVELADHELTLASHRFSEGVSNNIEVVNAQTSLARARSDYLESLVQYHIARLNLYFSRGKAESFYLVSNQKNKGV